MCFALIFLSRTIKKLIRYYTFYFGRFITVHRFTNDFLCINLMSLEPIAVQIVQLSLILIEYDIKCDKNLEKRENALLEQISK